MLEFAHTWAFLLLPLPLLVIWLAPPHRESLSAVRIPFFAQLAAALGQEPREGSVILNRRTLQLVSMSLIWLLLVAGLARPQWVGPPVENAQAARDIILAIDISGSMDRRDFASETSAPVQRLAAVKDVVSRFIAARRDDRIGLIVFGTRPFLQVPLTQDLETAKTLLNGVEAGMAGPHTTLGDAIGLAIRIYETSEVEERLLILLTDGSDTGSRMTPLNAAEIARQNRVTIFTIGAGDPEAQGEDRVDFETLRRIASITGGAFFTAENQEALDNVYDQIGALVPRIVKISSYRPRLSLVHWPAAAALLLGLLTYIILLTTAHRRAA